MAKLSCVCCDKELRPVHDDEDDCYQPYSGVVCTSHGNYGSRVFDPMDGGEMLFFVLCDECLVAKRESIYLQRTKVRALRPATNRLRVT